MLSSRNKIGTVVGEVSVLGYIESSLHRKVIARGLFFFFVFYSLRIIGVHRICVHVYVGHNIENTICECVYIFVKRYHIAHKCSSFYGRAGNLKTKKKNDFPYPRNNLITIQ